MGALATTVFAVRNIGKTEKRPVAACQALSVGSEVANTLAASNNAGVGKFMAHADSAADALFKKIGGSQTGLDELVKTTGASSKIGAFAQSAVNPLLCAASGVRVLKDDDQYAALIEEGCAMGAMFGMEGIMKYARSSVTGDIKAAKGMAGAITKAAENSPKIKELSQQAGEWFKNLGKGEHGNVKQTLVKAGIDALFVGGSILAFKVGKKIGEHFSHRDKKEVTNQ